MVTEKSVTNVLRRRGYKLTPQRRAIIATIMRNEGHLTPAEIYEDVRKEYPAVGLVTVYRTIEMLSGLGLICEVHAGGSCRSYLMRRPSEHHHHLICSGCGKVVDFAGCDLGEFRQKLSRDTGFEISGHLLEFLGRCRDCQRTDPASNSRKQIP